MTENEIGNQELMKPAQPVMYGGRHLRFTRAEGIGALLTLALAFLYTYAVTEFFAMEPFEDTPASLAGRVIAGAFVLFFLLLTELLHRAEPRTKESWFWLVCTLLTAVGLIGRLGKVWEGYNVLFLHCFAVYYALARSGRLVEGRSGAYVVLDGWHAFFGWPFRYFYRLAAALFCFLFRRDPDKREKKAKGPGVLWALPALVLGGLLLAAVIGFLGKADDTFGQLVDSLHFQWEWPELGDLLLRLHFATVIGSYLFGMLDGPSRKSREELDSCRETADRVLGKLGRCPSGLWIFILGLFTAVYVVFFVIQGQYLFSALLGQLPEGFTASGYARQGFFELCKVMVVNFVLLWLVHFTSDVRVRESRLLKLSLTLLMAESCLLAVTALSKLILYIHRFGFTPLRIESSWLVTVLLSGCVLYAVRLWTEKKTFRIWLLLSCGLLAATQLF